MKIKSPIRQIIAAIKNPIWYAKTALVPSLNNISIIGPEINVPANPHDRKKVVLYTANNFPRILAGIKTEAITYEDA